MLSGAQAHGRAEAQVAVGGDVTQARDAAHAHQQLRPDQSLTQQDGQRRPAGHGARVLVLGEQGARLLGGLGGAELDGASAQRFACSPSNTFSAVIGNSVIRTPQAS